VKGFGLGLNYVKQIVEAHRGKVTLESAAGNGCTFKIFMPY
jgi:two-component system phosphate regulon sensor histidine kinase PhoR